MKTLELQINEISTTLHYMSNALEIISYENFDDVMADINVKMQRVNSLRNELKTQYAMPELIKYEENLKNLTKQIRDKVDNIIVEIKIEQNDIQNELNNILNKKKLANYHR